MNSSVQILRIVRASSMGWFALAGSCFLGQAPLWFRRAVLGFLLLNPWLLWWLGPFTTGWLIVIEFIFLLAASLYCHPLLPGGLLALEVLVLGLTSPQAVYGEIEAGLPVLLLVIFMVAGVHMLRDLLFLLVNHLLLHIRSRLGLNLVVLAAVSALSAFLDALTIVAILVAVAGACYEVYDRAVSRMGYHADPTPDDEYVDTLPRAELEAFRAMLRGVLMHGAVGTAIGGVCTLVGEPENLVIGTVAGWNFGEFFVRVAPAALPTLVAGLLTCVALERWRLFGFGHELPAGIRQLLLDEERKLRDTRDARARLQLVGQVLVTLLMIVALAFHLAEIGLIGLAVLILSASLAGPIQEQKLAQALAPGLPFAALLTVFFAIVALIESQHLFTPIMARVLSLPGEWQVLMVYFSNGLLSALSDNVFVATIYMDQLNLALEQGLIDRAMFDRHAVAVVMGTGIPSMATPNGQAAFLFLLTSPLAAALRLGYRRMVWMALPYVLTTSVVAGCSLWWLG